MNNFQIKGRASFIVGGAFGSEGKGAAAAYVASRLDQPFNLVTTNAGSQSGHTSVHNGDKRVVFHLPTAPLVKEGYIVYLNAGCAIDVDVLMNELREHDYLKRVAGFYIHPNAAIIDNSCKEAEQRPDSAQTKIASTRKGVGEALSRKLLRSATLAKDSRYLAPFIRRLDLNARLQSGQSVLVEVPQGNSLSLNGKFYPHCTSRDCTVGQAASDAGIHPCFVGPVMVVLRTFPIRVGSIIDKIDLPSQPQANVTALRGYSGDCYPDQTETTWEALGVPPEITTVTGRVRRVFTWSQRQVLDAFMTNRPTHVYLSHVDYLRDPLMTGGPLEELIGKIWQAAGSLKLKCPQIVWANGPSTSDVYEWKTIPTTVGAAK